jgi:hypothetical protein
MMAIFDREAILEAHPHLRQMAETHDHLWTICKQLPEDYEPWGNTERVHGDCSCACKWYMPLEGQNGYDWGVCTNPASHRVGLLTFEHQGCAAWEPEEDDDDES